jgi:hypothetical protein
MLKKKISQISTEIEGLTEYEISPNFYLQLIQAHLWRLI